MTYLRTAGLLGRHAWTIWRAGQLRFRLETFGVYYPALPYQRPAWQVSPRAVLQLARGLSSYAGWVIQLEEIRKGGSAAWWNQQFSTGRNAPRGL